MPSLRWTYASDHSHWVANHGDYKCTITKPDPTWPLPMYHYEVRYGDWERKGGASSLRLCQTAARQAVEHHEDTQDQRVRDIKAGKIKNGPALLSRLLP